MADMKTGTAFYEMTVSQLATEDNLVYTAYGIAAFTITESDATKLDEISDVSTNFQLVRRMVEDFNQFDLHLEHFRDAVYDIICGE